MTLSGWGITSGYYFDGLLDDVRIYNPELSAAEVLSAMNGEDESGLADGPARTYTYDAVGNLTGQTDRDGRTRQFTWEFAYDGGKNYRETQEQRRKRDGSDIGSAGKIDRRWNHKLPTTPTRSPRFRPPTPSAPPRPASSLMRQLQADRASCFTALGAYPAPQRTRPPAFPK